MELTTIDAVFYALVCLATAYGFGAQPAATPAQNTDTCITTVLEFDP